MTPAESVFLCEGYHDRAFLNGWLLTRGCESWKNQPYPPHGKRVTGRGQYAFRSVNERWLRIVPTHGDTKWKDAAAVALKSRHTHPLDHLVIVLDDDTQGEASTTRVESFETWARDQKAVADQDDFVLSEGPVPTRLSLMLWSAPDEASDLALPAQQTLERLICAAIAEAHPKRAKHVQQWLQSRPSPPNAEKSHKAHAASHMAGWFSEHGSEDFFRAVWDPDESGNPIQKALEARLTKIGASTLLERVLQGSPSKA